VSVFTEAKVATCIDPELSKLTGMGMAVRSVSTFEIAAKLIYFMVGELGSLKRLTSLARYSQLRVFLFFSAERYSTLSILMIDLGCS
jgi:hypothetical protein